MPKLDQLIYFSDQDTNLLENLENSIRSLIILQQNTILFSQLVEIIL